MITGLGMVSPLGNDVQSSWSRLLAGESGAAEITAFDHTDYNVHFACELKDFDPTVWIDRKASRRMDRFAQMILAAARQAEADSGVDVSTAPDRFGASIATGIGGLQSYQDCYHVLLTRGPDRVSPFSIPSIIPNMGAGWVSIELGTKGPLMSECTACAASNMAIGDAMDEIRLGRADVMFAGGTEAPITEVGIAGFDAMRALSRRNDDPARASRPFDNERDGLVMGEAAAVLVLEELEHAKARGAKIYAELLGYGISSDASHMTEPDPTGESPARAMTMALARRGRRPDRGRLRERARDVDAARRRRRDAGDQARVRRGARDDEARRLLDEGRHGPLLRRGRRGRGGLHDAGRRRPEGAADDQLRRTRIRTATSTTCRTRRATCPICASRSRTRSASADTTRRSSSAASRTSHRKRPASGAKRAWPAQSVAVRGDAYRPPCASSRSAAAWSSCTYAGRSASTGTGSYVRQGLPPELVVRPRATEAEIDDAIATHLPWLERQLAKAAAADLGLERLHAHRGAGPPRGPRADRADRAVGGGRARRRVHAHLARDQRSRWGSCSRKGDAELQLAARARTARRARLRRRARGLPSREHHHGPAFWALVEQRRPDYRESKDWLDEHGWELLAYRPPLEAAA